jgi:hypothetical protein
MIRKKKIANYSNNPNYLDYLTALRKFFTNDVDIIPILSGFNFYINGVYGTPYTDLFRMYDENFEDIHGSEKTKQFIDDGTIGIINAQIYANGGSLIQSLENLRMYINDRAKKYTIAYNPFVNAYAEYEIPKINDLGTANPVVTDANNDVYIETETKGGLTQEQVNERVRIERLKNENINKPQKASDTRTTGEVIKPTGAAKPKNSQAKSIWKYLSFLSYKNSTRYKKQIATKYGENTGIGGGILNKNNG